MTTRKKQPAGKQAAQNRGQNREKISSTTTRSRKPAGKVEVVPAKPSHEELAATANQAYRQARAAGIEMVEYAIEAGTALAVVKDELPHGKWTPWLEENFEGSVWTARAWVRLAANREHVTVLEDVSLRKALAALRNDPQTASSGNEQTDDTEAAEADDTEPDTAGLTQDLNDEVARATAEQKPKDQRPHFEALARLVRVTDSDEVVVELVDAVTALVKNVGQTEALERLQALLVSA